MSDQKPKITLKIGGPKKSQDAQDQKAPATPQSATAATPKLTLKFGSTSAATPSTPKVVPAAAAAAGPKPSKSGRKPKPTAKKRTLDTAQADGDDDESDSEPLAKSKVSAAQPPLKKIKISTGGAIKKHKATGTAISSSKAPGSASGPKFIKLKKKGEVPKRPLGVGYDSEASDCEEDPAIDSALILRMAPGEDCDYLRSSIANNTLGVDRDVHLRFMMSNGRRACLTIRGRHYAAVLVDLPCVIEAMKSWNKKEWYKSSDICQMLIVLGRVASDKEAETYDLKNAMTTGGPIGRGELDEKTWAWAHGLTPPMRWVRKRRFRKRISTKLVEEDELEVERLLKADADAKGGSTYRHVDVDALEQEQAEADYDDSEDADGDMEEDDGYEMGDGPLSGVAAAGNINDGDNDDDDDDDLEAHLEAEMLKQAHEGDDFPAATTISSHIAGTSNDTTSNINRTSAHLPPDAASPTLSASAAGTFSFETSAAAAAAAEEMATSPSDMNPNATTAAASPASSDDDEDDDDSDEDDDENDSATRAAADDDDSALEEQQDRQRQREEIADLEAAIAREEGRLKQTPNQILKQKIARTIQGLKADLELKVDSLGGGGGGGGGGGDDGDADGDGDRDDK